MYVQVIKGHCTVRNRPGSTSESNISGEECCLQLYIIPHSLPPFRSESPALCNFSLGNKWRASSGCTTLFHHPSQDSQHSQLRTRPGWIALMNAMRSRLLLLLLHPRGKFRSRFKSNIPGLVVRDKKKNPHLDLM